MYMAAGRQFLVIMSPGGVVEGQQTAAGQVAPGQGLSPDTPRGYIAFALPK
jgi:hypothetical protein